MPEVSYSYQYMCLACEEKFQIVTATTFPEPKCPLCGGNSKLLSKQEASLDVHPKTARINPGNVMLRCEVCGGTEFTVFADTYRMACKCGAVFLPMIEKLVWKRLLPRPPG